VEDSERRLAAVVDEILESYAAHGNINHLDGSNLPSRAEVSEVLDDLISVMFPGFFGQDHLDELTSRYFVGERCARCLRQLEKMIGRAIGITSAPHDAASPAATADLREQAHGHAVGLLQAIPELRRLLVTDVQAALTGDPAACSDPEVITSYPGVAAIAVHRIAHYLQARKVPLIPRMMSELVHSTTGIDIHPGAEIGHSFFIDHGTGVVIGETTVIGNNVKLYQGVTLGAMSVRPGEREEEPQKRHPTLEDEVTVYSGATILGGDTVIGSSSVIGGNVWLTQSVPPGTTVMLDKPTLRFVYAQPQAKPKAAGD
jgi:serine O-acetyltransferase